MNIPSLRPSRALIYSILVVSIFSAKLLHLFQHVKSLPVLQFIVYFPTFFIPDLIVAIVGRGLLHPGNGILPVVGLVAGTFLAIISLMTASSQIGFHYVTGAEMQWEKATSIATDATAVRLMFTGVLQVSISGVIMIVLSWLTTPWLYNKTGLWMSAAWNLVSPSKWEMFLPTVRVQSGQSKLRSIRIWPFCILAGFVSLCVLLVVRPAKPYNHISTTLPFALLRIFAKGGKVQDCDSNFASLPKVGHFPLSDLIKEDLWKVPKGNFKGWAPGTDNLLVKTYKERRPEWLLDPMPDGFYRWETMNLNSSEGANVTIHSKHSSQMCPGDQPNYYNPVADPMRISNLDLGVYEPLKAALEDDSILVSHIVLVTMESARKDLFPMREGSNLHKNIIESYNEEDRDEGNKILSGMTPVAEQLTGEPFWSNPKDKPPFEPGRGIWKDPAAPGMGGINVMGGISGSSLSFKSVLNSHCGVFPLPVDFLEEVTTDIYQPCIPHILNLLNQAKDTDESKPNLGNDRDDYRAEVQRQKWKTMFVQSTTDTYDRQNILNTQMGISESVVKDTLDNPDSEYSAGSPELNYFGYPDADVKPVFRDIINKAVNSSSRLFLSHFTSTTHHPWKIPDSFNGTTYTGPNGKHTNMNKYLNTIHYDDFWMGEILGLLEEAGIANETLCIFIGDHGQAFDEDAPISGTYKNPHISNFRVPLIFRHPHLPRINVEANATSMTILPTILDILANTKSLDSYDTSVVKDLVHEYEGQSLIRPFKSEDRGRQSWNIGIINAGGAILAVSSAATKYRLIVPLKETFTYTFSDLETDPNELDTIEKWTLEELISEVRSKHNEEAVKWLKDADEVTRWWVDEMHRRWNYETDG